MDKITEIIASHVSENTESSTPADDSAETSTETTASEAAGTSEPGDAAGASQEAAPEQEQQQQPAPEQQSQQQPDEDDLLATAFGGNPNNRIPYKRVRAIVDNAVKRAREAVTAEFQSRISELESARSTWERAQNEFRELAQTPERMLQVLAHYFPKQWADLVKRFNGGEPSPESGQQPASIEPDVVLADGSYGYSQAAIQRVLDSKLAEQARAIERRLTERFKPIEDRVMAQERYAQAAAVVQRQLEAARKLPHFVENEKAIAEAMRADETLTLEGAYLRVVLPKLTELTRKNVIAEINSKRPAAGNPGAPGVPAAQPKPQTVDDIIRAEVRKAAQTA